MKRDIFIGDVHGCIAELDLLLKETSFNEKKDRLFFTGDVVGKGPCSIEVLELIKGLKNRAAVVMGNHEHGFCLNLDYLCSKTDTAPIDEKTRKLARILKKTGKIDMLRELPYMIKDKSFILIHQGLIPGVKVSKHTQEINKSWRRIPHDWYKKYNGKREVIYGHWAKHGLQKRGNTTGIDTACVDGGYLTAYIPKSGEIIQQKCLEDGGY